MRRRATLPHPLECSTIAVPGLSFRVRKGTGRLTWAMTTAKPIRYGRPEKPAAGRTETSHDSGRGGPGTGQRTQAKRLTSIVIATTRNSVPCHPTRKPPQDETRPARVGKSVPRSPVSTGRLHPSRDFHLRPIEHVFNMRATDTEVPRNPNLGAGFPLRCFQRLSLPNVANRPCRWRDNRHTRGPSTQVLSYYGQASSGFQRAQRIETKLSHDVLNPARVPL